MKRFRLAWRVLTKRQIMLTSDVMQMPVWINRIDRWTRPGYWFQTQVYKQEWGEWREVGIFPERVTDERGRLVALRIHDDELAQPGTGETFYIDDSWLGKI